jgi:predicted DNA binding protein
MEMLRLTELTPRRTQGQRTAEPVPPAQREALQAAIEHGYYETPRQIDLSDLAAIVEVPRSTLSYRLRRAEAQLVKQFVAGDRSLDSLSPTV